MSALIARGEADFRFLRETLGVTDGNLSIHLTRLEEAGYVLSTKEFVRKKPHTRYEPTEAGRAAFRAYLAALEKIVQSAGQPRCSGQSGVLRATIKRKAAHRGLSSVATSCGVGGAFR
jgi:DNA-binding MarR family transcriptional regulator